MKTWKHADWIIQVALFVIGAAFLLLFDFQIWSYLILGGWQVLSCIVNYFWKKGQWKVSDRKGYIITVIIVLLSGFIIYFSANLLGELIFVYLIGLLILSPLMALWYISICYREWKMIRTKEFMHLK